MLLSTFIKVQLKAGHASNFHAHDYTELVLVDGSEGTILFDKVKKTFPDKSLLIHPAKTYHQAWNKHACRHLCLGMKGPLVEELTEGIFEAPEKLRFLFHNLTEELAQRESRYREIIENIACEIVYRALRLQPKTPQNSASTITKQSTAKVSEKNPRMNWVKKKLENSLVQPVDLETLSDELLISKDYLRHAFKKEFGISPIQFVIQQRIEQAKILLDETDLKLREIAERTGFESEFYFSRLFRQVVGTPPASYRKNSLKR